MANKVLSIEVGHSLTKICEVDFKVKNPRVYSSFTIRTPKGVYEDGYIKRTDEFATVLDEELVKQGIKTKQVVFSISSTKIANREVYIPFVKENKIFNLLVANSRDYFPVDISDYQLAYNILDTVTTEDNKQYKLLVLAAPKDLLESYYALAVKVGLTIVALDYSGNSIVPIVRNACTDEVTMVIKVDERSTMLTVFQNRNIVLQRNVAYGSDIAIATIIELPAFGDHVSYFEALKMLREKYCLRKSFDPLVQDEGDVDADDDLTLARSELTEGLRMMVNSILRVVDYYNSRNTGAQIQRYILTGVGGNFQNLSQLMSSELGSKVSVLSEIEGVKFDKLGSESGIGDYISCIGACIAPIDLIPDEHKDKKRRKVKGDKSKSGTDYKAISGLLLAGGILVSAILAAISTFSYITTSTENQNLKAKVSELEPIETVYDDFRKADTLHNDVLSMYASTQNPNEGLTNFLTEMEQKMPSDIAVESFTADTSVVTIAMKVGTKEEAMNAIAAFRTFTSLSSVEVLSIQEDMDDTGNITESFTVTGAYAPVASQSENAVAE